jgi:hypothetical protein
MLRIELAAGGGYLGRFSPAADSDAAAATDATN